MKFYKLLILIFFLISCTNQNTNDYLKLNLKGKVKSINQIPYSASENFGKISLNEFQIFGAIISTGEDVEYGDVKIMSHEKIHFNERGLIEEKIGYYDINEQILSKTIFKYDEKNRLISEIKYKFDNSIEYKNILEIQDSKNKSSLIKYGGNGNINAKEEYFHDTKLNKILEKRYTSKGELKNSLKFEYEKKNIIKTTLFNNKGNVINNVNYEYEGDVKIKKSVFNNKGEITIEKIYEYDSNKNIIKLTLLSPKDSEFFVSNGIYEYTYDEFDNLKSYKYIQKVLKSGAEYSGSVKYEYEYDDNNNWIKLIYFKGYVPKSIIIREIEYY
jgi:hypothetical protein